MTLHDDEARLHHMLEHSREAVEMLRGRTREELESDRQLNLSLVRLMEIVGEAAARTSTSTQEKYEKIPWPEIISFRNRLIHGYDDVDFDILWNIVRIDLPLLIEELKRILGID